MELEAGMYIKTQDGRICKILKLNEPLEDDGYLDHNDIGSASIQEKNVIKASFNIIDLIEVGDYVNDAFVLDFETLQTGEKSVIVDGLINYGWGQGVIPASEIKEVVTKEQFNSCKYVVERDK